MEARLHDLAGEAGRRAGQRRRGGIEKGRGQAKLEDAVKLVNAGLITIEDASGHLGVPVDDIREAMAAEE